MISPAVIALFILGGITASALLAFWWAAQDGQFENVKDGAKTVFDEDERLALARQKTNANREGGRDVSNG
jgi:cbb3-type cytochrome oxidase maturation protein